MKVSLNWRFILFAALTLHAARSTGAQAPDSGHGPMLTKKDGIVFAAGAVATGILLGADERIANYLRMPSVQASKARDVLSEVGNYAGDPGTLVVGAAIWLNGRRVKDRTQELVGYRTLEALAAAGTVTFVLKMVTGRARPDESPDNAMDFRIGRGIGNRNQFQSFPSGHVSQIFAFASAIDAELNQIAPKHPRWLVPMLYGLAATGAASRFYRDRHWASDVAFGATIGFVAGRAVVRWHNDQPATGTR